MLRLLPRLALRAAALQAGVTAANAGSKPAHAVHAAVRDIYASLPDVHAIPEAEEEEIDETGGHEGYGELTPPAVTALLRLVPLSADDAFFDLGSGAGVVVTQLALLGFRAVGIELSPTRHAVAVAALAQVPVPHRCEARREDLLAVPCDDATVAFIAGLLFDDAFMTRLGRKLATLPRLRAIATLSPFPPDARDRLAAAGYEERGGGDLECTWGPAPVYLYVRPAPEAFPLGC